MGQGQQARHQRVAVAEQAATFTSQAPLDAVHSTLGAVGNTTALAALLEGDELDGWGALVTDATTLGLAGITPHAGPAQGSNQATLAVMRLARAEGVNHAALASLRLGGGRPLPPAILARVNAVFGADFSHVRLHQDAAAARMAEAAQARAFTVGNEIWFNSGELDLGTPEGVDLLLHELTHVMQHDEGRLPSGPGLSVSSPHDPHEQEAERVAASLAPAWESASWAEDPGLVGDGLFDDAAWASAVDAGPSSEGVVSRAGGEEEATPSPMVKGVQVGTWTDSTEAALIGGDEIKPPHGVEGGFASRGEAVAWAGPQLAEGGADGGLILRQGERWFAYTMTVQSLLYDFTAENVTGGLFEDTLQANLIAAPGLEGFITQDGVLLLPHTTIEPDGEGGAQLGLVVPADGHLVAPREADYDTIVEAAQAGTLPPMDEAGAVALFKGVLKAKALERLRENRAALEAMEAQYAPGADGGDERWERLRELMAVDNVLAEEEEALEAILAGTTVPMPILLRFALSNPGMLSAEELERLTTRLQGVQRVRDQLHVMVPELVALESRDVSATQEALQADMSARISDAKAAMEDVSQRVLTEDIPLTKLGPVVRDTLTSLGITQERATSGDALSAHVLDWIASEDLEEQVITWGGVALTLTLTVGAILASGGWLAVLGLGARAALGLSASGAAVGFGEATYNFERADDLNAAGEASGAGSPNALIDDPDAARFNYVMAWLNLALAVIDVGLALNALRVMSRGAQAARYLPDADVSPEAVASYARIVSSSEDVGGVARSLGVPRDLVARVKRHLFLDEHVVAVGPDAVMQGRFVPVARTGELWEKAARGALNADEAAELRRLIAHEAVEAELMARGLPYRSSHPSAWDDGTNWPSAQHYGAHDLAPLASHLQPPFRHWEPLFKVSPSGLTINDDLSNISQIVDETLKRILRQ
jgi:hypothetical protein